MRNLAKVAAAIFTMVVIYMLLFPSAGSGPVAPSSSCRHRLKNIWLALENYHTDHGSYPPAYVTDSNGNPLYSWRVLLLPYLDQRPAYTEFDLSKAWDAPENEKVSDISFFDFRCPNMPAERSNESTTNYLAVIGPDCAWSGSKPMTKSDLGNDLSNVILLVEVADTHTPWAKPEDFVLSEMADGINTSDTDGISSYHCRDWTYTFKHGKPGANVLFADGHGKYLDSSFGERELRGMLTISGSATSESENNR